MIVLYRWNGDGGAPDTGAGFLEAVYQAALAHELTLRGVHFEQLKRLSVTYQGVLVGDYVADFVIEDKIILELKSASTFHPRHEAQALNYLTAAGFRLAILLNFGSGSLEHKRIIRKRICVYSCSLWQG